MTNPNGDMKRTQAIAADVTRRLDEKGVPPEKHREKIIAAIVWWPIAVLMLAVDLYVLSQILVRFKAGQDVPLTQAIILLALPTLVMIFAVKKADSEALTSFFASLLTFGKGARDAAKGSGS